jgi:hypothetical protein
MQQRTANLAEVRERYGRLFFRPDLGRGLFPYNVGCLEAGKSSVACLAESRSEAEMMHDELGAISGQG